MAVWIGKKDNFLFAKSTRTVASIRLFVAVFDAQRNFVESATKTAVNAILERESAPPITLCRRRRGGRAN